jgi:hypothetical protein
MVAPTFPDEAAEFDRRRPGETVRPRGEPADSTGNRRGRPPKGGKLEPFCIRLDPEVRSRLERAADLSRARSVGAWAREVLATAADVVLARPPGGK